MAALVDFATGSTDTVDPSTTLLVVAITRNDNVGAGETCEWGTTQMSVASNSNGFVQIYYLIDPPAGLDTAFPTGTNVDGVFIAQYSGDLAFDSAAQGSVDDHSVSPSAPAVMAFAMIAGSTAHTPIAGCTERFDTDGNYFCDRIETSGGTYSVGTTSSTDPDSAVAVFTETVEPPPAASLLSFQAATLANSTSQSVAGLTQTAGSNRVIYVGMGWESANAPETVSNPQWAGQAMETVTDGTNLARAVVGTGFSAWIQWFQIREADLPADAGTKTFTCTLSAAPGQATGRLWVVQVGDASQDRNVESVDTDSVTGDGDPAYSLTCSDGSVQVGSAAGGNAVSWTPSAGFTEQDDTQLDSTSGHHCMTQELVTGTTVNAQHTASTALNRYVGCGFSVAAATAANSATMALLGVPVAGSGTGSARLASTQSLVGAPVAGSGTGVAALQSTAALLGVPIQGTGSGAVALTATMALDGVPVQGTGSGQATLTATMALDGVPLEGAGSGAAALGSVADLTGVPLEGAGSGAAALQAAHTLAGVPVAGAGTGSAILTGTLSLTGVPVAGAGTGSAQLNGTLTITGVPVAGLGTGQVVPVVTMSLVGVPIQGAGTGEARLASTMALVGAAMAGAGTGVAALLATQTLTGVPVAGAGTGAAALQSTHALTGAPITGAGTGEAALSATMGLTGVPIEGTGTGQVPTVSGLNLIGVPIQGAGTGAVSLTSTFQLSGVPIAGSGTGSAKLTAQLEITGVPIEGAGAGAARLLATMALAGAPLEGAGSGAAQLSGSMALTGAPVSGAGLGSMALQGTMSLRGVPIQGSGTGEGGTPAFQITMDLIGVPVTGAGTGEIIAAPTGQTQAQAGEDESAVMIGPDRDAATIAVDDTVVVLSAEVGVTVTFIEGITNVKVGPE